MAIFIAVGNNRRKYLVLSRRRRPMATAPLLSQASFRALIKPISAHHGVLLLHVFIGVLQ